MSDAPHAPVSRLQRDMLDFAHGPGDGSDMLVIRWAHRLLGPLDRAALRTALADVVQRHTVLRSAFLPTADGAGYRAEVRPRVASPLTVTDVRHLPPDAREEAWRHALRTVAPLSPGTPPHLRATLLVESGTEARLLLEAYHPAFDGWSQAVVDQELAVAYAAACAGRRPSPWEPDDFGTAAAAEARLAGSAELARAAGHWSTVLRDLPVANRQPPVADLTASEARVALEKPDFHRIVLAAARNRVRPSTVCLTAWLRTLSDAVGSADVAVAMPVALRDDEALGDAVGPYVNQVLVRAVPGGPDDVRAVLRRVDSAFWTSWRHRAVPYQTVLEALGSDFRYRFRFGYHEGGGDGPWDATGVSTVPLEVPVDTTLRRDAALELTHTAGAASGVVLCRDGGLPGWSAGRLAAAFTAHVARLTDPA
ncbi:condensation domain-containing protein [Streptomyces sp. SID10815]|uniref:condensation domain-containing protein n=1 Tax=Streptomyces sp. SID10815 TaxID=2706027 RepID=UPI0013CD47EE|nr:hypothetical protein [Streptomyces sp. SID10815]